MQPERLRSGSGGDVPVRSCVVLNPVGRRWAEWVQFEYDILSLHEVLIELLFDGAVLLLFLFGQRE